MQTTLNQIQIQATCRKYDSRLLYNWWNSTTSSAIFEGGCGLGVIIRYEKGQVMLSGAKKIRDQLDCETAEAQALLFRKTVALKGGFPNIIVETNSLIVVNELLRSSRQNSCLMMEI